MVFWISYTNVEGKKSGSIQLLLATQSRGSGFSNMKPEPWAARGLTDGFWRPRLPTARHGRLQALGLSRHITTRRLGHKFFLLFFFFNFFFCFFLYILTDIR